MGAICPSPAASAANEDVQLAQEKNFAFVFIKPHAVTEEVKALVRQKMSDAGVELTSEGEIKADVIDSKMLIDNHYGAIAAKAMKLKPETLNVQPQAKELFKTKFGLEWDDALKQNLVYSAVDACEKLKIDKDALYAKWSELKKGETLLKFGGGFYVGGKIDGIFVVNGFYMDMRKRFTMPGTSIYYYTAEWYADKLTWADFRGKVLGVTDPAEAAAGSIRNTIYKDYKTLGLKELPDTGLNGVHASASPFEGLCERSNWLETPPAASVFGKALLSQGIPEETIKAFMEDPAVECEGKTASCFDQLEDLDGKECLEKLTNMTLPS